MERNELVESAWAVLMPHADHHHPECPAVRGGTCNCWAKVITARINAVLDVVEPDIRDDEREVLRDRLREMNDRLEWHVGEYGDGFRTATFAIMSILGERDDE